MPRFLRLRRLAGTYRDLFRASRLYRWSALASLALVAGMIAIPVLRLVPELQGTTYIPLHYNIYFGIDQFGPWYRVFTLPALGLALFLLNLVFEGIYFHQEHVLAKFFAVMTVATELILFVSVVFIVLLNI